MQVGLWADTAVPSQPGLGLRNGAVPPGVGWEAAQGRTGCGDTEQAANPGPCSAPLPVPTQAFS